MKTVSFKQYEFLGTCELGIVLKHLEYSDIQIVETCRYVFNDKGDSMHLFFEDGEIRAELHRKVVTSTSSLAITYGITHILDCLKQRAFKVMSV